jgi:peptidyl-prolyl cis-trans isomerase D
MLQILRNKAQSTVMQAVVIVISLVFIFWGVGTQLMNRNRSAITVNDENISFQQFQKAYDQAESRLRDNFNGAIPPGFAKKIGLKQQVINQLVQEALFRQGGHKMGLIISPAEIQHEIQNMPQFEDNGTFNNKKYKYILAQNRYTPHGFEDSIRSDMLFQKTVNDIKSFASIVTDQEIKELFDLERESVEVSFAEISPQSFKDKVHVQDKALATWYDSVKEKYKTDPQLKLEYLAFDYNDIAKKISLDEASIKQYYNKNIDKFSTPEMRHVRHILFKLSPNSPEKVVEAQREKAEKVLKLAKSGQNFAKLAETYSQGPSAKQGGDIGFIKPGQTVPSFNSAVFSMKTGEISGLVRSRYGFHIIKLVSIKPADVKPLSQVHNEIVQELKMSKAKAKAFQLANDCYEGIIQAGSLQAYIKKHPDASVIKTPFFTRQNPPASIKDDSKFLDAAFALKQGELSSLIESKKGYAILYAEHIKQPSIPKLADIKERVIKDYIDAQATDMARKAAEDILMKAKKGGDFAKIVQAAGSTVQSSGLLSKGGNNPKTSFPATLIDKIFQLSGNSPYPETVEQSGNDFFVYKFDKRLTPKMDLNPNEREQYKTAILRLKQQEILNAWIYNAQKHATITTSKRL